jgi:hypothetical protein
VLLSDFIPEFGVGPIEEEYGPRAGVDNLYVLTDCQAT